MGLNQDGITDYNDYTSPVVTPGYLGWPGFELPSNGTAVDSSNPLFTPFEVLRDFRQIPRALLLPIIKSSSQGDHCEQDHDRIVGGILISDLTKDSKRVELFQLFQLIDAVSVCCI